MGANDYFTKKYSVDNLIKGTEIEDAICFLIDNSLDAAEKISKNISKNINIEIILDDKQLLVKDNCLGISFKEAQETVFKIGQKTSFIDLYGQGLKKAILTIGKEINIRSVRNKESVSINLKILDNKEKDLWEPSFNCKYSDEEDGFLIKLTKFTNKMNRFVTTSMNSDKFTKLKNRISYKYRYILQSKSATIEFNGDKLEAKYIEADKVDEKSLSSDELKVTVKLFKNVRDKSSNGVDFIINNRCVVEKEKSKKIDWNMKIRRKGHSYIKFFGEVIIETNDIERLGVNPSKNKINFTTTQFQEVLDFMVNVIEENRLAYKKPTISVQLDIEVEEYTEWKEILENQGDKYEHAKDLVEHLYILGVNVIRANK